MRNFLGFAEIWRKRACPENSSYRPLRCLEEARVCTSDSNSQNTPEEARTSSLKQPLDGVVMGFLCPLRFDPRHPGKVK